MLNTCLHPMSRTVWLPLLLLVSAHGAHARECFENGVGEIVCSGLSTGARIGIAIAIFVIASVLLVALAYWRRRRARNQNLVYVVNPGAGYPVEYDTRGQPYNPYGAPAGYPQYPPQAYPEPAYNSYAPPPLGPNKGYNNVYPSYSGTPTGGTKS